MNGLNNMVTYDTVTTLDPIVTTTTNCINRYYLINQPYIIENQTMYMDHIIKHNIYQTVDATFNNCDYTEENFYGNNLY